MRNMGTIELPGFVIDMGRGELRDETGAHVNLRAQAWSVLQHSTLHCTPAAWSAKTN
jgi:hypothetical protein